MIEITELAYAKINTFLDVLGKREDGYHEILTHMQAVTLFDRLMLRFASTAQGDLNMILCCDDARVPTGEENLIIRAGRAFLSAARERGVCPCGELTIQLEKHIPMAAGLAGGSADAAAMLRGMNALFENLFSMEDLCGIGAKIGADVPFCIRCKEGAMTAGGIGELLEKTQSIPENLTLLIACTGEGVSTPWAYRQVDELISKNGDYPAFLRALSQKDLPAMARTSFNIFENVVLTERPAAKQLMESMRAFDPLLVRMSGSGPAIVGYFEKRTSALSCAKKLQKEGLQPFVCQPIY